MADLEAGTLTDGQTPDYLVLLQEVVESRPTDVTTLARAKGLSSFFVPVLYQGEVMRGNAILSTKQLVDSRPIALPQERQPRTAVAAAIEVAGQRLFVVSAHLENRVSWYRGGLFSDNARGRQADVLLRALPSDQPGILGGDLNTWLGRNEPAWRAFDRRFADTPAELLSPTFRFRLVLDHLLFDLPAGWQASRRVLPDRYGSDHHPVMGVIRQSYTAIQ